MGGEQARVQLLDSSSYGHYDGRLQGAGKTTTTGKLANLLRKKYNRKPILPRRHLSPCCHQTARNVGKQLDMPVFSLRYQVKPVEIAKQAIEKAKEEHLDYVLIDTAGRLHIDETSNG